MEDVPKMSENILSTSADSMSEDVPKYHDYTRNYDGQRNDDGPRYVSSHETDSKSLDHSDNLLRIDW